MLLGRCAMPGYFQLRPTPLPGGASDERRQSGSMKRGGVGACFKVCQQPWTLEDRAGRRAERAFPARQLSRLADVPAYVAAGVKVLKLQGRSLPADTLGALVGAVPPGARRGGGRPVLGRGPRARAARDLDRRGAIGGSGVTGEAFELTTAVSSLDDLRASDLDPYDAVYLGNLYLRALRGEPARAARRARATRCAQVLDQGRRAYVTTYAAPRQRDVESLRRALEAARAAGALAAEVHSAGLARLVRDEFPELAAPPRALRERVHRRRRRACTGRSAPPASRRPRSFPSTRSRALARAGVPVEVTVHGKLPLGVSESVPPARLRGRAGRRVSGPLPPGRLPLPRGLGPEVRRHRRPERAGRVSPRASPAPGRGRAPALPRRGPLGDAGLPARRGPGVSGGARPGAGRRIAALDARLVGALRAHSRAGFCNGFAFGRSGLEYVGAVQTAGRAPGAARATARASATQEGDAR